MAGVRVVVAVAAVELAAAVAAAGRDAAEPARPVLRLRRAEVGVVALRRSADVADPQADFTGCDSLGGIANRPCGLQPPLEACGPGNSQLERGSRARATFQSLQGQGSGRREFQIPVEQHTLEQMPASTVSSPPTSDPSRMRDLG